MSTRAIVVGSVGRDAMQTQRERGAMVAYCGAAPTQPLRGRELNRFLIEFSEFMGLTLWAHRFEPRLSFERAARAGAVYVLQLCYY